MTIHENYSLLPHNSFGLDVRCRWFIAYNSVAELQNILSLPLLQENPYLHIGGGSNLLFLGDYNGVILHSQIDMLTVEREDAQHIYLRAGAGILWDDFVAHCVTNGWGGVENLSYIPGEVGASAVQNIGAYGVEAKDVIVSVDTLSVEDGSPRTFSVEECEYGYRKSIFKGALRGKYIVTSILFRLNKRPSFDLSYGQLKTLFEGKEVTLEGLRQAIIAIRKEKLPEPSELGNAGSFFMNPIIELSLYKQLQERYPTMPHYPVDEMHVKVPAGWLIEQSGWKGKSHKGAAVHDKQALVLVNKTHATARDVQELAALIVASVYENYGITIHPEVNYIQVVFE